MRRDPLDVHQVSSVNPEQKPLRIEAPPSRLAMVLVASATSLPSLSQRDVVVLRFGVVIEFAGGGSRAPFAPSFTTMRSRYSPAGRAAFLNSGRTATAGPQIRPARRACLPQAAARRKTVGARTVFSRYNPPPPASNGPPSHTDRTRVTNTTATCPVDELQHFETVELRHLNIEEDQQSGLCSAEPAFHRFESNWRIPATIFDIGFLSRCIRRRDAGRASSSSVCG